MSDKVNLRSDKAPTDPAQPTETAKVPQRSERAAARAPAPVQDPTNPYAGAPTRAPGKVTAGTHRAGEAKAHDALRDDSAEQRLTLATRNADPDTQRFVAVARALGAARTDGVLSNVVDSAIRDAAGGRQDVGLLLEQRAATAGLDRQQLAVLAAAQHPERRFDPNEVARALRDVVMEGVGHIAEARALLNGRTAIELAAVRAEYEHLYHPEGSTRGDLRGDLASIDQPAPGAAAAAGREGIEHEMDPQLDRLLAADRVGADAVALARGRNVMDVISRYRTPEQRAALEARFAADGRGDVRGALRALPPTERSFALAHWSGDPDALPAARIAERVNGLRAAVERGDAEGIVQALRQCGSGTDQKTAVAVYDRVAERTGAPPFAEAIRSRLDETGTRLVEAAARHDDVAVTAARLERETGDARIHQVIGDYLAGHRDDPQAWDRLVARYDSVRGNGAFVREMAARTSGDANQQMRELIDGHGKLRPAQLLAHALTGSPPDMAAIREALWGRSPAQIEAIEGDFHRLANAPGTHLRLVMERAKAGMDDGERAEVDHLLQGSDTPERQSRVVEARQQAADAASIAGWGARVTQGATREVYRETRSRLAAYAEARRAFGDTDPRTEAARAEYTSWVQRHFEFAEQHGRDRDQVTDDVVLLAGLVAMAMPAGQGLGSALLASAYGTTASIGVKLAMNADRYRPSELATDAAFAAADGALGAAAHGVAALRGGASVASHGIGQTARSAAMSGVQVGLESGARAATDRRTWERGDVGDNLARAMVEGAVTGAAMSVVSEGIQRAGNAVVRARPVDAGARRVREEIRAAVTDPGTQGRVERAMGHVAGRFRDMAEARRAIDGLAHRARAEHLAGPAPSPTAPIPADARVFDMSNPADARLAQIHYALAGGEGPPPARWSTNQRTYIADPGGPGPTGPRSGATLHGGTDAPARAVPASSGDRVAGTAHAAPRPAPVSEGAAQRTATRESPEWLRQKVEPRVAAIVHDPEVRSRVVEWIRVAEHHTPGVARGKDEAAFGRLVGQVAGLAQESGPVRAVLPAETMARFNHRVAEQAEFNRANHRGETAGELVEGGLRLMRGAGELPVDASRVAQHDAANHAMEWALAGGHGDPPPAFVTGNGVLHLQLPGGDGSPAGTGPLSWRDDGLEHRVGKLVHDPEAAGRIVEAIRVAERHDPGALTFRHEADFREWLGHMAGEVRDRGSVAARLPAETRDRFTRAVGELAVADRARGQHSNGYQRALDAMHAEGALPHRPTGFMIADDHGHAYAWAMAGGRGAPPPAFQSTDGTVYMRSVRRPRSPS